MSFQRKLITVALSTLVIFGAGCALNQPKTQIPVEETQIPVEEAKAEETLSKLLIAQNVNHFLTIEIYNTETNELEYSKSINPEDILAVSRLGASGANDAAQYDEDSSDLYYMTDGESAYDGSCMNKDGTCNMRIYRYNLISEKTDLMYDMRGRLHQWLLDDSNDAIYIRLTDAKDKNILYEKIDTTTKKTQTVFSIPRNHDENMSFSKMRISNDKKYLYQTRITYQVDSSPSPQQPRAINRLDLVRLNLENGDYEEFLLHAGDYMLSSECDISPDGKTIAFYGGLFDPNLIILDLDSMETIYNETKKDISNIIIYWSGDSKEILMMKKSGLYRFNLETKTESRIAETNDKTFVMAWAMSTSFITTINNNTGKLELHNVTTGQKTQPEGLLVVPARTYEIVGLKWFK